MNGTEAPPPLRQGWIKAAPTSAQPAKTLWPSASSHVELPHPIRNRTHTSCEDGDSADIVRADLLEGSKPVSAHLRCLSREPPRRSSSMGAINHDPIRRLNVVGQFSSPAGTIRARCA